MDMFSIISLLTVLAAAFAYINFRFFKLPTTIGLMVISLIMSLLIFVINFFVPGVLENAKLLIGSIDLSELILDIMLSFLLFAGALHTDYEHLKRYLAPIITLASIGVIVSTILVAFAAYAVLALFDIHLDFIYLLLFGVLIAPTDPTRADTDDPPPPMVFCSNTIVDDPSSNASVVPTRSPPSG